MMISIDYQVTTIEAGEAASSQQVLVAFTRAGRLPFQAVHLLASHIEVTCADGVAEQIGSEDEPLSPETLAQTQTPEGLTFVELNPATQLPTGHCVIKA